MRTALWHCLGGFLAVALTAGTARADLDPDCLAGADSFICAKDRVQDAKDVDELAAPVLAKEHRDRGCVSIQYVHGDDGKPDTILVSVKGSPGMHLPECTTINPQQRAAATSKSDLKKLGTKLMDALAKAPRDVRIRLLSHVGALNLGNGYGGEAEVKVR